MSRRNTVEREREYRNWQEARDALVANELERTRKQLTERHKTYLKAIEDRAITIAVGLAGTAKTSLACEVAAKLFKQNKIKKIILVRPLVECDEETGFLPGDIREKMTPFIAPLTQWLASHFSKLEFERMWATGQIEAIPLAIMRGRDFQDCIVIVDEAQGATYRQLKMVLTRVGENCRLVLCGDLKQSDIENDVAYVPLLRIIQQLGTKPRLKEIALINFTESDVLRSDLVRELDRRLIG